MAGAGGGFENLFLGGAGCLPDPYVVPGARQAFEEGCVTVGQSDLGELLLGALPSSSSEAGAQRVVQQQALDGTRQRRRIARSTNPSDCGGPERS
jgi:hypothetical protein